MKKIIVTVLILMALQMHAQTGIGTTTPNASAKLDVYSTNKGFLPPRVTLASVSDATTITSPAEGLLVYNLGSSGLQSGYYYWNGANWATIATASSAGNGVTAMDMVKLYGEAYSTATGKISNTSGYSFTVPVSGRYLFDFSSTTWGGNSTTTFKVRQGTTDLGTDSQTSLNNNVHVEYNGKIEVNLQAGITYNVVLTTNANRDSGDYDRVYYKMVAGNLPVTGQSVDYAIASLSANQSISAVGNISFNTIQGAGITLTNGGFNLLANKTYKLEGSVGGSSTGYIYYAWVDATNTIIGGSSIGSVMKAGSAFSDSPQDKAVAIYTPTSNTTVYLRVLTISGTSVAYPVAATPAFSSTWATIQQVGSSAFVNPWVLSGSEVYNITGEVGIGNTAPNAKLDVRTSPTSTTDPGAGTIGLGTSSATAASVGIGALRYNTSTSRVEVSNGSAWKGPAGPIYAQFQANASQSFYAAGGKVSFPTTVINNGGITITGNNTITLPAGRIYRVDFNMGWTSMAGGWSRFAIYNAGTSTSISTAAHLEAVTNNGGYAGSGATTTFVDATSGSIQIDVRYVNPANFTTSLGDPGSSTSYPFIVIQAVD
jgi:acetyltransferase-like isoleucine patch superfamily enzyme